MIFLSSCCRSSLIINELYLGWHKPKNKRLSLSILIHESPCAHKNLLKILQEASSTSLLHKTRAFNNAGSHKNTGIVHWQSSSHCLSKNDKVRKKKKEEKKGCEAFKLNHQRIIYIHIEYVICYKARVQLLHISLAALSNVQYVKAQINQLSHHHHPSTTLDILTNNINNRDRTYSRRRFFITLYVFLSHCWLLKDFSQHHPSYLH